MYQFCLEFQKKIRAREDPPDLTPPKTEINFPQEPRTLDIDLNDFFDWAEDYVWYDVLPKEGKVKYPWIDFSRKVPAFVCPEKYFVNNNLDLQPPEQVITLSGGRDPHEEVLSPSDINLEKVKPFFISRGQWRKVHSI